MKRAKAFLRRKLWRAAFDVNGGLRVEGRLPRGGCVVVANHSSHADTPALLAALDARHMPHVAAAADYWFGSPLRTWFCRALVAGFPVRRRGGGYADLLAGGGLLDRGGVVVVFPSGSREADADRCHAGAFRLAAEHGVPVVPVTLTGTDRVLPVHGRVHRGAVVVRICAPVDPTDIDRARAQVASAWEMSSQRSSTCSMPTDMRTSSSGVPMLRSPS